MATTGWGAVPLGDRTFDDACLAPLEAHLAEVRGAEGASALARAIERLRETRSMPLIDDSGEVTFLYLAPEGATVEIDGDLAGWNLNPPGTTGSRLLPMTRLPGTRVHTAKVSLPPDARIEYGFRVGGRLCADPGARTVHWNGFARPRRRSLNAAFTMPGYRDEFADAIDPRATPGTSNEYVLEGRRVSVYFPASEPITTGRLPAIYMADGSDFTDRAQALEILDTLVWRGDIPPVICVTVDNAHRELDFDARGNDFVFSDAFAEELVAHVIPFVESHHPTDPRRRFVAGVSLSGSAMGALALRRPDAFSGALLQSPLLGLMRKKFDGEPAAGAQRWWIDIGTYDLENAQRPERLEALRAFVESMRALGHHVDYRETHEGHNWTSWRARLPAALRSIFG